MYKTKKPILIEINNMVKDQLLKSLQLQHINEVENEDFGMALEEYLIDKELLRKTRLEIKSGAETSTELMNSLVINLNRSFNKLFLEANKTCGDEFVFPMLRKDDFKDANREYLTKFQFNQIMSKTTMHNKRLKRLMKICKIEKNVSSHTMRHTYSNQVLTPNNANIYEISKSLGHSSIKETEAYLRKFDKGKVKSMMDELSERFE
jgi:integrase